MLPLGLRDIRNAPAAFVAASIATPRDLEAMLSARTVASTTSLDVPAFVELDTAMATPRDVEDVRSVPTKARAASLSATTISTAADRTNSEVLNAVEIGARVCRGPDWMFGNQDGGPGAFGTVIQTPSQHLDHAGMVWVRWDNGKENNYRFGSNGCFDLKKAEK